MGRDSRELVKVALAVTVFLVSGRSELDARWLGIRVLQDLPLVEACVRAIDLEAGRILVTRGFAAPG